MGKTKIEWTGKSWNPLRARRKSDGKVGHFCVKVSAGCKGCYAERQNGWTGTHVPYALDKLDQVEVYVDAEALQDPLRWRKPTMIFPCSMTDLFADFYTDEMIDQVMAVMALCSGHTFQVLTKRPERMLKYFGSKGPDVLDVGSREEELVERWGAAASDLLDGDCIHGPGKKFRRTIESFISAAHGLSDDDEMLAEDEIKFPLPNVWLGVSVENQAAADERIPLLLKTPAAVRWISAEPLLGPIDLDSAEANHVHALGCGEPNCSCGDRGIDWVVVGGESGARARPMHPEWARSLRNQCKDAGVAFFFKQWGEYADLSNEPAGSPLMKKSTLDEILTPSGTVLGVGYRTGHKSNGMVEPDWKERGAAWMGKVGKSEAGRLLDGVEWSEYPVQTSAEVESLGDGGSR
jgi:protein gp37